MRKNKNKRNIKEDEIFPIFNHKLLYKKEKKIIKVLAIL